MKKILLVLICACATSAVFAQSATFGIRGGVNLANLNASSGNISVSTGSTTSFAVGLFADLKVNNNVSIQPALNYTGKGGNIADGNDSQADIKLYYLQVPVNIVYHIPVLPGNIYLGAGPYVGVGLSGKVKFSNGSTTESQDIKFGSEGDFKRTDVGLNGIAGIEFKNGLIFGINYDLGLTDIGNDGTSESATRNRVFGISVGFKF